MDYWKQLARHQKILYYYIDQINRENYQESLTNIYNYVKSVANSYYNGNKMHEAYTYLIDQIIKAEEIFPHKKAFNVPIDFTPCTDIDNFVEYVIYLTRRYLIMEHCFSYDYNINKIDFTNDCKKAAHYIKELCDAHNIESNILAIHPGYDEGAMLFEGGKYHFGNIIKYNGNYYLVDVTYSQFFYTSQNILDRIGVMDLSGCLPGVFMLMNEKGKNIAQIILEKGYIELTEDIFKTYLDAFTISFRNGLYYENTNDFSYTTEYSADNYIKFLKGEDSQVIHEGKENLGFQKRPLKN